MRPVLSFAEFYESIWLKIPEVWRNADASNGRPLQVLTLTMAQQFYYQFYLKIASLDELFDVDKCPARYLPFLASMVSWKLVGSNEASWRQQIKSAPLLYKIKGTKKGITIAEKLIGYSVFISELYRDYTGTILPKEKLFNAFPDNIKTKPWFRTTSPEISKHILGNSASDQLAPFNEGTGYIDSSGNLVIPNTYKRTKTSTLVLSTTQFYNPLTGAYSKARLAKVPRINVVLKKINELDYVDDKGIQTEVNVDGAIDLLLTFKPFHVLINELSVLFDLSDYVLGYTKDKTGGEGTLPGDSVLSREYINAQINIPTSDEEKINYYEQSTTRSCELESLTDITTPNKGSIILEKRINATNIGTSLTIQQGLDLGFSNRASNTTFKIREIDFVSPILNVINLKQFFNLSGEDAFGWPLNSEIECPPANLSADYANDTVIIKTINQNKSTNTPWDVKAIQEFLTDPNISSSYPVRQSRKLGPVSITLNSITHCLQDIVKNTCTLVYFHATNGSITLQQTLDFKLDILNSKLYLNTFSIANRLGYTNDTYMNDSTSFIYLLYPTRIPDTTALNVTSGSRNYQISGRKHTKFNRVFWAANANVQATIDAAKPEIVYDFDESTGVLIKNEQRTRLFKEPLARLYSRSSLQNELIGNLKAIVRDPRTPRDTSYWKVYSEPSTIYSGSEHVSRSWWSNYFNVPVQGVGGYVKYETVDTSAEAQEINKDSYRWKVVSSSVDETNPNHFLATRKSSSYRNSFWTRGSASKASIPYIGSSRATSQCFRNTTALFNRSENLSDYKTPIDTNLQIGNYAYETNNIDYTSIYYVLDSNILPSSIIPNTFERIEPGTNKLRTKLVDPSHIEYPVVNKYTTTQIGYTPQYDSAFDYTDRDQYYANSTTGLKPSFYANNIRTDVCPYDGSLLDDNADSLEILISGLQDHSFSKTITTLTDTDCIFPLQNVQVMWRYNNTGTAAGTGFYISIDPSIVRPSVQVFKNGLEIQYGISWTMAADIPRVILTDATLATVTVGDIILVKYQTIGNVPIATYPTDPDTGLAYTALTSSPYIENTTVSISSLDPTFNQYLYELPFGHIPIVSWYRQDTAAFINCDVPKIPTAIAPSPKAYKEIAMSDIQVKKNGTPLVYLEDWEIIAVPSAISYKIRLFSTSSTFITNGDILTVEYTGLP